MTYATPWESRHFIHYTLRLDQPIDRPETLSRYYETAQKASSRCTPVAVPQGWIAHLSVLSTAVDREVESPVLARIVVERELSHKVGSAVIGEWPQGLTYLLSSPDSKQGLGPEHGPRWLLPPTSSTSLCLHLINQGEFLFIVVIIPPATPPTPVLDYLLALLPPTASSFPPSNSHHYISPYIILHKQIFQLSNHQSPWTKLKLPSVISCKLQSPFSVLTATQSGSSTSLDNFVHDLKSESEFVPRCILRTLWSAVSRLTIHFHQAQGWPS